jgi:hypothetical protein
LTFWVAVAASPRVLLVAGVDDLAVVVVQIAQRAGAQRGRAVGWACSTLSRVSISSTLIAVAHACPASVTACSSRR